MLIETPGEHPVNCILDRGLPFFTPEVDDLIRRAARIAPRHGLLGMFDWRNLPPLPKFQSQLEAEVGRLEEYAEARGWEVE